VPPSHGSPDRLYDYYLAARPHRSASSAAGPQADNGLTSSSIVQTLAVEEVGGRKQVVPREADAVFWSPRQGSTARV
jgi:hypothetical protein